MRTVRSAVLIGAYASVLMSSAACSIDGKSSGAYRATYEVPVAPDLEGAAVYDVPEVEWEIASGRAKLEYDLPHGLVGKEIRVEFIGPVDASSSTATLTGPAGTAECDISSAGVSCLETMAGLLPISPDYAVIEQLAEAAQAGLSSKRLEVAKQFSIDPIGIVHIDLTAPADDSAEVEIEKEHD